MFTDYVLHALFVRTFSSYHTTCPFNIQLISTPELKFFIGEVDFDVFLFYYYSPVGDLEVSPEVVALLPPGYLPVSVKSGQNVVELRENIEAMLLHLTEILQERQEIKDRETEKE